MRREITYKHHNELIPQIAIHAAYNGTVPASGNVRNVLSTIYTLWLIRHGEAVLTDCERPVRVGPGHWIIITPGIMRSQSFIPGTQILSVHFSFEQIFFHQFLSRPGIYVLPAARMAGLQVVAERFIAKFEQTFKTPSVDAGLIQMLDYKTMEDQWFSRLFTLLVRHGVLVDRLPGVDARVDAAIAYLDQSDYGLNVPYEALEKCCGLGRVQLDRIFKEQLNLSPKNLCDRITLARAMRLLSAHDANCKEVSYRLHFATVPHFCHWFHRHSGMTPNQFRKSMNY